MKDVEEQGGAVGQGGQEQLADPRRRRTRSDSVEIEVGCHRLPSACRDMLGNQN